MVHTFGQLIRQRMSLLEIRSQRKLQELLADQGAPAHENMISRWVNDQNRPTGARLAALLDVLQIKTREERAEACRLACMPLDVLQEQANRPDEAA